MDIECYILNMGYIDLRIYILRYKEYKSYTIETIVFIV